MMAQTRRTPRIRPGADPARRGSDPYRWSCATPALGCAGCGCSPPACRRAAPPARGPVQRRATLSACARLQGGNASTVDMVAKRWIGPTFCAQCHRGPAGQVGGAIPRRPRSRPAAPRVPPLLPAVAGARLGRRQPRRRRVARGAICARSALATMADNQTS
jgi:hypothetical protein